jgi:hypothetical protein
MDALLILVALALGLTLLLGLLDELVPFRATAALTRILAVAIGAGLAWMLGYSAFAAFGQELRADWMHPVATGLVLVAVGEFVRSLVAAIARRSGEQPAEASPGPRAARAA